VLSVVRPAWDADKDLVFCCQGGTESDHHNVRRALKDNRGGRSRHRLELRCSFVSVLSDGGTSAGQLSHLMGTTGTAVTEGVYRHHVAVLSDHVEPVNRLLGEAS
jgi:hypothetical protein